MKLKLMIAAIVFIWIGMILAISMESIVKFSTPTLTKPVAFDVGRVVFGAFNKAQALLLVLLILAALFAHLITIDKICILAITIIFLLQVFWLFPDLSQRVDMVLSNVKPPPSYKHALYGMLELAKLLLLIMLGVRLITVNC